MIMSLHASLLCSSLSKTKSFDIKANTIRGLVSRVQADF